MSGCLAVWLVLLAALWLMIAAALGLMDMKG